MSKRARIVGFSIAGLLVVAGIAAGAGFSGTLGQILALILISLGLVLATSLVFLEVGLSEDREHARVRAREERVKDRERKPRLGRKAGPVPKAQVSWAPEAVRVSQASGRNARASRPAQ